MRTQRIPFIRSRYCHAQGFTLIEVLVAALLMFLVITTMMTIYQGAMLSSEKALQQLRFSGVVPELRAQITQDIRTSSTQRTELNGAGDLGEIQYTWLAQKAAKGRAFHPDNLPGALANDVPDKGTTPLHLWEVKMTLRRNTQVREYTFWELSW